MEVDTTLAAIASAWRWNLPGLTCCAALLVLYGGLTGFRLSRSLTWFLVAETFLAIVVCSPLDLLARQYLFTAEAVEQITIGLVASYLFVLSVPEEAVRRLRIPWFLAWVTGMAALSMWNFPRLLNASLNSSLVRASEYAALVTGGAVFWWPLHSPSRKQRIPLVPHSLLYLAAATVWCSMVGLFVAFGRSLSSAYYLRSVDPLHISELLITDWSFTRETDQETAGLLFWIATSTILLTEVMFVYYRWYKSAEVR